MDTKSTVQLNPSVNLPLSGDWRYVFICQDCSNTQNAIFTPLPRSWLEVVRITIYNLTIDRLRTTKINPDRSKEKISKRPAPTPKKKRFQNTRHEISVEKTPHLYDENFYFQFKTEICNFMETHWNSLSQNFKHKTPTWHNTVTSIFSSRGDLFLSGKDLFSKAGYWSLLDIRNPMIGKGPGDVPGSEMDEEAENDKEGDNGAATANHAPKKRKAKRRKKGVADPSESHHSHSGDNDRSTEGVVPVVKTYYHPLSKYDQVQIAKENSAKQLDIEEEGTIVSNDKGYRSARASHPAVIKPSNRNSNNNNNNNNNYNNLKSSGWYFEATLISEKGNMRCGWATERADVDSVIGYDKYSYSLRDVNGFLFHQSRGTEYGEPFGKNDVIGCWIKYRAEGDIGEEGAEKELIQEVLGEADDEKGVEPTAGWSPFSELEFFKNGESMGAKIGMWCGDYYPAVGVFGGARVKINFGPNFEFGPKTAVNGEWKGCFELKSEWDVHYKDERRAPRQKSQGNNNNNNKRKRPGDVENEKMQVDNISESEAT